MLVQNKLVDIFARNTHIRELLSKSVIGLESEMNRISSTGQLSKRPYPKRFGNRKIHSHLQTDFTEGMFELITPAKKDTQECLKNLDILLQLTRSELSNEEGLWPLSMPPFVAKSDIAWLGTFSERTWEMDYHKYLVKKYGALHGIISGLHFNFSFDETLIEDLHQFESTLNYVDFKNQLYFKTVQNIEAYRWLFIYLFGSSPLNFNQSDIMIPSNLKAVRSIRASRYGYNNHLPKPINYAGNLENHLKQIEKAANDKILYDEEEYFGPIRFKGKSNSSNLEEHGVDHIELRFIDSNPFSDRGITQEDLNAILLLINTLFIYRDDLSDVKLQLSSHLADEVALQNPLKKLPEWADIDALKNKLAYVNNLLDDKFASGLSLILQRIEEPLLTPSAKLISLSDGKKSLLHDWATKAAMDRQKNRALLKDTELTAELLRG